MPADPLLSLLSTRLDDYLADLRTLVAIDSGPDAPEGAVRIHDWLAARLAALGAQVERRPRPDAGDDLLATLAGGGRTRIVLLGHSDTVFRRGTAAERPLSTSGPQILGPGTCDMKAGLLSGLYALEALLAAGLRGFGTVDYLCVADEERSLRTSPPLIRAVSRGADAVLTLEAARANGDIVTARKGILGVRAEFFGRAAHAGVEPEAGRSAVLALLRHALALDALNDPAAGVTVNVGVIEGGTLPNVVPERARMEVDVRAFEPSMLRRLAERIRAQLAEELLPGVRVEAVLEEISPPMARTPAVARLEAQAQQIARQLGFEVGGSATGGAADGAFAAAEGAPVLDGLGPVGGLDHGPHEYILAESIVPRAALLARLITEIDRRSPFVHIVQSAPEGPPAI